eukprot:553550-Prymnesium_polylepis.1
MLCDERRNGAYHRAICRAVASLPKGSVVLEIGSGSGLLAMMAAKAGASNGVRVVGCEMHGVMAVAAQRVVAANGFSKQR